MKKTIKIKLFQGYEDTGVLNKFEDFINDDNILMLDAKFTLTPDWRESDGYISILAIYQEKNSIESSDEPLEEQNTDNSINVQDNQDNATMVSQSDNNEILNNIPEDIEIIAQKDLNSLLNDTYTYMEVPDIVEQDISQRKEQNLNSTSEIIEPIEILNIEE